MESVRGNGFLISSLDVHSDRKTVGVAMKRAFFLILILGLLVAVSVAKDVKFGYIISARILDEYPEAQDAQKILNQWSNKNW